MTIIYFAIYIVYENILDKLLFQKRTPPKKKGVSERRDLYHKSHPAG